MKKLVCSACSIILLLSLTLGLTACGGGNRVPEDFSFAISWNHGVTSYDSATGVLVKESDATHPEDYTTEYRLTEQELQMVWQLIQQLDIQSYPDQYDPNPGKQSKPPTSLILTVRTAEGEKTIAARGINAGYESPDPKGQKFLDVCRAIEEILTGTKAWKDLPEFERLYR